MFSFLSLFCKKPEHSVLSNPVDGIPPYGFHRWHYRILELASYYSGRAGVAVETLILETRQHSADRRLCEMAKMWVVDVERFEYIHNGRKRYRNVYHLNRVSYDYLRKYFNWYNKIWN